MAELFDPVDNINKILNAIILFGFPSFYLWRILGLAAVTSPAILLISVPFNAFFIAQSRKLHEKRMREEDKRMGLLVEALSHIKASSMFSHDSIMEFITEAKSLF